MNLWAFSFHAHFLPRCFAVAFLDEWNFWLQRIALKFLKIFFNWFLQSVVGNLNKMQNSELANFNNYEKVEKVFLGFDAELSCIHNFFFLISLIQFMWITGNKLNQDHFHKIDCFPWVENCVELNLRSIGELSSWEGWWKNEKSKENWWKLVKN